MEDTLLQYSKRGKKVRAFRRSSEPWEVATEQGKRKSKEKVAKRLEKCKEKE